MSLLGFLFIFNIQAADLAPTPRPQSINWAFSSMSSKMVTSNTGLFTTKTEIFHLYKKGLKDYQHTIFYATVPRIEQELKSKRLVCYTGSSEAERRKEFAYLTSQYVQPSPKIIMLKPLANKLLAPDKKSLSLRELIKNPDLVGIVGEARSYGASIDRVLNPRPPNIKTVVLETFSTSSMQMIINRRADYTIEYETVIKSLIGSNPHYKDIVAIPINDVDLVITQYLACSKTPEGLAVVKRADQIIRENVQNSSYWAEMLESIPRDEQDAFKGEMKKFIEARKSAPIIIQ